MGRITSFIMGAAIGATAALLFAPQAGEQTRAFVAEKASAVADEAKDFSGNFPASAQGAIKNIQEKGSAVVKDATGKVSSQGAGQASAADADELREKIEAARQRIAAQVMENAEQSKAAAAEVQDAAAVAE